MIDVRPYIKGICFLPTAISLINDIHIIGYHDHWLKLKHYSNQWLYILRLTTRDLTPVLQGMVGNQGRDSGEDWQCMLN